ncbi:Hsp20/alpha crystallin family protein [Magnetospirillum gryphiswaldense]|uniref:Heat shock protein Hsp20 n=1 Tax=Magnetospirillum gryphiswaldense TaxID=55518 RepID=A4U381_9PROT|nr:Hsp20/alpha crystallin family protein [Magnetospirillum gryphiswaldense]AVM75858.1 Spore protein SP21 [Magnetospirillum gryphiswaldense MSR-1]AVM79761.1 Spore protein SP21 [Magnetospirillum gryphiswaldense]CAM77338.1 Heat shock protein Hsp20 [Magnetospirillum gryphiswaldense MSR-1]
MADKASRHVLMHGPASAESGSHPLVGLRDEVDRLFHSFFPAAFGRSMFDLDPLRLGALRLMDDMTPQVDVKELADHYEIDAELPGVEVKDVKVTIDNGMLDIRGEKHGEHMDDQGAVHVSERSFGSFARAFRLPEDADADTADAEFVNGVLKVKVPKQEGKGPKVKDIEIKAH